MMAVVHQVQATFARVHFATQCLMLRSFNYPIFNIIRADIAGESICLYTAYTVVQWHLILER